MPIRQSTPRHIETEETQPKPSERILHGHYLLFTTTGNKNSTPLQTKFPLSVVRLIVQEMTHDRGEGQYVLGNMGNMTGTNELNEETKINQQSGDQENMTGTDSETRTWKETR